MSPEQFVIEFVGLYKRARIPTFQSQAITRARCRTVSGGLEDLVAFYIDGNAPGRFRLFVDQPVSLGKGKLRYPDVVVQDKSSQQVTAFVDVKTDLGWKRSELKEICRKLRELADGVAGRTINLGAEPRNRKPYQVSPQVTCHLVIGTSVNSGDLELADAVEIAAAANVRIYTFLDGRHPNHFSRTDGNEFEKLRIRRADMAAFLADVQGT